MFVEGKKCMQHLETFNLKAKESVIMRLELSRKKIPSTTNITYKKLNFNLSLTVLSVTFSTMAANAGIEAVRTDLQCHSKLKKKKHTHTHLTVIGNIARISHQKLMTFYCHKVQLYKNAGSFTLERLNLHL